MAELRNQANRGRPLDGRVQHYYYWHPIRCAFGNPSLDLYELRHFCTSYMLNDLDLHAEDVAAQLAHTDGGVLVQRLYGHPSTELARKRTQGASPADRAPAARGEGSDKRVIAMAGERHIGVTARRYGVDSADFRPFRPMAQSQSTASVHERRKRAYCAPRNNARVIDEGPGEPGLLDQQRS